MTFSPEQIDLWRSAPSENQNLEFKEAKVQFDNKKLFKYCVALANEGGGHLLLGVADEPPRPVVGTAAFNNTTEMAAKLLTAIGFRVDIHEIAHPDGRVLVFEIPSRPRGTAYHYNGTYLMRSGEELVPMSEDQLRRIFAEDVPDWLEENAATDCTADDVIRLLDTQCYFDLMKIPYPTERSSVLERFESEGLVANRNASWDISNFGAVVFAKDVRDFSNLSRRAPRFIHYQGNSKLKTRLDQPGTKGIAVGFERLVEFVSSHVDQNEVLAKALREEVKMFPTIAIRELIANGLIHQDFNETGSSVRIELYSDRLEVSNPGTPLISPDRFIDEYKSRNEKLADLMRRLRICEEKSSGIDKVVNEAEMCQLPPPDFRVAEVHTSVVMFAYKKFADMNKQERIRACYQHSCLRYVMNEATNNQSLRGRFNLSEKKTETVSRIFRDTQKANLIKLADPSAKSTRYRGYVPYWA